MRERGGEVRGIAGGDQGRRRQPGREEVAGARGRARRARARPPGREEDDRGSGGGLGRWESWAGSGGCTVRPGKLCSFYFFPVLFVLFNIFCHCFQF